MEVTMSINYSQSNMGNLALGVPSHDGVRAFDFGSFLSGVATASIAMLAVAALVFGEPDPRAAQADAIACGVDSGMTIATVQDGERQK
jgi:hypothetical protein